jgi:hypothetical protein
VQGMRIFESAVCFRGILVTPEVTLIGILGVSGAHDYPVRPIMVGKEVLAAHEG